MIDKKSRMKGKVGQVSKNGCAMEQLVYRIKHINYVDELAVITAR